MMKKLPNLRKNQRENFELMEEVMPMVLSVENACANGAVWIPLLDTTKEESDRGNYV